MDKQGKENNTILAKRDDGVILDESNNAKPPEQMKEQNEKNKEENNSSAIGKVEEQLCQEDSNGVVERINNQTNKLVVGLWKTSQNYEVTTGH